MNYDPFGILRAHTFDPLPRNKTANNEMFSEYQLGFQWYVFQLRTYPVKVIESCSNAFSDLRRFNKKTPGNLSTGLWFSFQDDEFTADFAAKSCRCFFSPQKSWKHDQVWLACFCPTSCYYMVRLVSRILHIPWSLWRRGAEVLCCHSGAQNVTWQRWVGGVGSTSKPNIWKP